LLKPIEFEEHIKKEIKKIFDHHIFEQQFIIKYSSQNLKCELTNNHQLELEVNIEETETIDILNGLKNTFGLISKIDTTIDVETFFEEYLKKIGESFGVDTITGANYFIPLLTQVRKIRNTVADGDVQSSIHLFLAEFVATYHRIRANFIKEKIELVSNNGDIFDNILRQIIRANVKFDDLNDDDYLMYEDGRKAALTDASSGEQTLLPVLTLLKKIYIQDKKMLHNIIYFEEPELHIFPKFQNMLLQLLMLIHNRGKLHLFITTHSPFVLTSFNNLIQAGEIQKQLNDEKQEALDKLIHKDCRINSKNFSAFQIKNGKAINIVDEESGLIGENIIDEVGDKDFDIFSQLMEIQYGVES